MPEDAAKQPPPDKKTTNDRGTAAQQRSPEKTELTDEQAAEALRKINEVQSKLEPGG